MRKKVNILLALSMIIGLLNCYSLSLYAVEKDSINLNSIDEIENNLLAREELISIAMDNEGLSYQEAV